MPDVKRVLLPLLVCSLSCTLYVQIRAANSLASGRPLSQATETNTWPRDSYNGPGGDLYNGPGGGIYNGPEGGAYNGPGGGLYNGPGGGLYNGPGGGLYNGPGGGLYNGPGGGLYNGPGGGLYNGPGGGLYNGPGGGLYNGPCDHPYRSNQPPREVFLKELKERGYEDAYKTLKEAWGL